MIACREPSTHFPSLIGRQSDLVARSLGVCLLCYGPLLTHREQHHWLDLVGWAERGRRGYEGRSRIPEHST